MSAISIDALTSETKAGIVRHVSESDQARALIGRRIREERTAAGFTNQAAFAEDLGIDPAALSRIETGKRGIDSVLLQQIADRLELPIDRLVRDPQEELVLGRQGETDDEAMSEMVGWANGLLSDIETMAKFVGREPLVS